MPEPVMPPPSKHSLHAKQGATAAPNQTFTQDKNVRQRDSSGIEGGSFKKIMEDKLSVYNNSSNLKEYVGKPDSDDVWGGAYYPLDVKWVVKQNRSSIGAEITRSAKEQGTPFHEPQTCTDVEVEKLMQSGAGTLDYQPEIRSASVTKDDPREASEPRTFSEMARFNSGAQSDRSTEVSIAVRAGHKKVERGSESIRKLEPHLRLELRHFNSSLPHGEFSAELLDKIVGTDGIDIELLDFETRPSAKLRTQFKFETEFAGGRKQVPYALSDQKDLRTLSLATGPVNFAVAHSQPVTELPDSAFIQCNLSESYSMSTNDFRGRAQSLDSFGNNGHGVTHTGSLTAVTKSLAQASFHQAPFDNSEGEAVEVGNFPMEDPVRSEKYAPDLSYATNASSHNRNDHPGRILNNNITIRSPQIPSDDISLEQVSEFFADRKNRVLELQLNPVELGRVHIRLVASNSGTVLSFEADRPETLEMMRENSSHLREEFERGGYSSITFDFDEGAKNEDIEDSELPPDTQTEAPSMHINSSVEADILNGLDIRV
ncbi:flagellar hook-length control protein FliK [Heliomarina baculiformis]|uniref:flagellar hook-length control protein FliK n=1 Tax=Heliomarina baculiformis TaxID=2872036 RepID=UPI001EE38E66|nr:flagellar hook-length control protein FliK [Heliomarina baculiformis]